MVMRQADDGFEVFMVRRHRASKFAGDLYVFPGGTIRADDRLGYAEARRLGLDPDSLHAALAAQRDPLAGEYDGGLSLWIAALRELFEEAGLLLAEDRLDRGERPTGSDGGGGLLELSNPDRAAHFEGLREQLQQEKLSLAALAEAEGLRLAADRLIYFSRWITPPSSPRRFDTRFFLAEVPPGQTAGHCQIETTEGVWISPRQALSRESTNGLPMMFVTREHIRRLAEFRQVEALLELTRGSQSRSTMPDLHSANEPSLTNEQRRW